MKSITLIMLLFIGFYTNLFSQSIETEKVKNLSLKKFEWLKKQRTDSLQKLIHDSLQYIHSNGWVENYTTFISNNTDKTLIYKNVEIEKIKAIQFNKTIIVTGNGLFEGNMYGHDFRVNLLFTEVYVKQQNNWFLINRHANKMP